MSEEIMPYNLREIVLPELPKLFDFPGDKTVTSSEYDAAMQNSYLRMVPLAEILLECYEVPVDAEDREHVKRMIVAAGWLDHLLDDCKPEQRADALEGYQMLVRHIGTRTTIENLPAFVSPQIITSARLLANAIQPLGDTATANLQGKAARIGKISAEKAASSDYRQYTHLLREEGMLTGDLATEVLSVRAKASAGYAHLHAYNRTAMIGATLIDSAQDLKRDFDMKLTSVPPNVGRRLYIAVHALPYIPGALKGLGKPGLYAVGSAIYQHLQKTNQ